MNENVIGKEVVDAAVKGFLLNFGSNLMKDGIERIVNGLPEERLGVFASSCDTQTEAEPAAPPDAALPHQ